MLYKFTSEGEEHQLSADEYAAVLEQMGEAPKEVSLPGDGGPPVDEPPPSPAPPTPPNGVAPGLAPGGPPPVDFTGEENPEDEEEEGWEYQYPAPTECKRANTIMGFGAFGVKWEKMGDWQEVRFIANLLVMHVSGGTVMDETDPVTGEMTGENMLVTNTAKSISPLLYNITRGGGGKPSMVKDGLALMACLYLGSRHHPGDPDEPDSPPDESPDENNEESFGGES